jgi:hypothetical protein
MTVQNFSRSGSRIRIFSILNPGSAPKSLCIFNPKKWFLSSRKYDPGCSSRNRILIFYPSRIQILIFYPTRILDPGVKKAPDPVLPERPPGLQVVPLIRPILLVISSVTEPGSRIRIFSIPDPHQRVYVF